MSSRLEDKFHEDIEKVIDDVKGELHYVMHINTNLIQILIIQIHKIQMHRK